MIRSVSNSFLTSLIHLNIPMVLEQHEVGFLKDKRRLNGKLIFKVSREVG